MTRNAEHTPTGYEDAASVVVNQAPAPSSLAGGEVEKPADTSWSDWPRKSHDRRYEIGMRPEADGGAECPFCLNAMDQTAEVVIVNHNGSLALCHASCLPDKCLAALSPEAPAREWSEFEDDISDALADSLDMDWTSRDGARAVVAWLAKNAPHQAAAPVLEAKVFKQAFWRLAFDDAPAFDNPGDCKWRLSASATRILAEAAIAAISPRHEAPADPFAAEDACLASSNEASDGYASAFYEIANLLGIGARTASPSEVWKGEMKPAIERLIAMRAGCHEAPAEGEGEVREVLWKALQRYTMTNMGDGDGHGFPLIDLMSNDGTTIDTGRKEMLILADHLSEALEKSALSARSSAPEACEGEVVAWCSVSTAAALKSGSLGGHAVWANPADRKSVALYTHPAALSADKLRASTGTHWWNPDNDEEGFSCWGDAFEDAIFNGWDAPVRLERAKRLPDVWAVRIDIDTTGDGEADDYEVRLFDTEAEALANQGAD